MWLVKYPSLLSHLALDMEDLVGCPEATQDAFSMLEQKV